jgi:poly(A) polymerase Pap1
MIRFIEVTQEDINNGVPSDYNKCAIALALKREYKTDDVKVYVEDYVSLCVCKNELNLRYDMDSKVLEFIDLFDNYGDDDVAEPFTLEVVEQVST